MFAIIKDVIFWILVVGVLNNLAAEVHPVGLNGFAQRQSVPEISSAVSPGHEIVARLAAGQQSWDIRSSQVGEYFVPDLIWDNVLG